MDNRTCSVVQEELPWLVNGTLPLDYQRLLWHHLVGCDDCRSDLIRWARLAAGLRTAAVDVPTALMADTWQKICQGTKADQESGREEAPLILGFPPLTIVGDVVRWTLVRTTRLVGISPSLF